MALKSTIFKATVNIADMDRGYYAEHPLTLARHPSETDERMMVRLLAFILFANERLDFGRGLSSEDEPALWQKDYTGDIERWIEVGLPDERLVRKASGRAAEVVVFAYGGRTVDIWWGKEGAAISRLPNVTVIELVPEQTAALTQLVQRSMQFQCTLQDGQLWLTPHVGLAAVEIQPKFLCRPQ